MTAKTIRNGDYLDPRWRTRDEDRRPGRHRTTRALGVGLLAGALLGSTLTGFVTRALEHPGPAAQDVEVRSWPERPLPREWRWSPPGADTSRMFRSR